MLLQVAILSILLFVLYKAWIVYLNYTAASKLGLPLVVSPITPDDPVWIAVQTVFGAILRHFPFDAISFTRHCRLGWEFHDRYQTHARLGDAWILVTPAKNWLYVASPAAVIDIFGRGQDFIRPVWMLGMIMLLTYYWDSAFNHAVEALNIFGPNVSTAEGCDWQRQRKLTAAPFNERKSSLVWSESLRQAEDMLKLWRSSTNEHGFISTTDDARTLALHVLAYVGFQKSYPFKSIANVQATNACSLTYRDSISIILQNALIIMVLPESAFSLSFLPLKWQRIGWAIKNFRGYMLRQIEDERDLLNSSKPGSGNLVSNLVRASSEDEAYVGIGRDIRMPNSLSKAEILGNIFVFNFAGHDTTAISLGYALLLLAAHQDVQNWVHEELQYYIGDTDPQTLSYSDIFPQLKRCLAVLLETLRLYNPLPGVPKYTGPKPTTLKIGNLLYQIPADVLVVPNLQALHTHPRYWGPDSLVWRPQRWITAGTGGVGSETLFKPLKGTYFPWSEGIRNCPGKKFAQVEFVAVISTLLANHVSEPVIKDGEPLDAARVRLLDLVKDSSIELLLRIRDPRSIPIRWRERGYPGYR